MNIRFRFLYKKNSLILTSLLCLGALLAPSGVFAQAGQTWVWGYNSYGQLGNGSATESTTAVNPSNLLGIVQVAGKYGHALALKSDATVWAWGLNDNGQVGDGTSNNRFTPLQVAGLASIMQVAAGHYHSLALKSDGTVWAWGRDGEGQLGDENAHNEASPVQVHSLTGAVQVAAGEFHSLALKSDGTVWAWGHNYYGQLGNGTRDNKSKPILVPGLTGVVQVACGASHSLALKSDGTVWTWGRNIRGQLGDGTTTDRYSPLQVANLTSVVSLAGGVFTSLVVKSDGTVWGWGDNSGGQLGDGTYTSHSTPIQSSNLSGVVQVAGGFYHSLALKSDGTVAGTGYNNLGQLGTGNRIDSNVFVPVLHVTNQTYLASGTDFGISVQAAYLKTKVSASTLTQPLGKALSLSARLRNALGLPLYLKSLDFKLDGVAVGSAVTNGNGVATLPLSNPAQYSVGAHTVSVSFVGVPLLLSASSGSATVTITKADTSLSMKSVSGVFGQTKPLSATLKRKTDGALLSGQTITFSIDGTQVGQGTTDGTGIATLNYKIEDTLAIGAHTLTASFAGDGSHNPSSLNGTLTTTIESTKITASSVSGAVGSVVKLIGKLKRNSDGKYLAGKTLSISVDGMDVGTVVTDANGVGTLSYTIPSGLAVGVHTVSYAFAGDTQYSASANTTTTLTVK